MSVSLVWQIFYWLWILSEIYIAVVIRTDDDEGSVRDRGSQIILWIVIVLALTACGFIKALYPPNLLGGAGWLKTAAVLLLIAGLTVRWTAILTLGRGFSANVAIRYSQQICRSGLYRFVRHPSYLGMLLIFLAAGVHSRNWLGVAVALIPTTPAVLYRIHVEEQALREAFGDDYTAYSATTKRLLPGVY